MLCQALPGRGTFNPGVTSKQTNCCHHTQCKIATYQASLNYYQSVCFYKRYTSGFAHGQFVWQSIPSCSSRDNAAIASWGARNLDATDRLVCWHVLPYRFLGSAGAGADGSWGSQGNCWVFWFPEIQHARFHKSTAAIAAQVCEKSMKCFLTWQW